MKPDWECASRNVRTLAFCCRQVVGDHGSTSERPKAEDCPRRPRAKRATAETLPRCSMRATSFSAWVSASSPGGASDIIHAQYRQPETGRVQNNTEKY